MIKNILEYQKIDAQILALKRNLEKDETKMSLNKVVSLVKDSQTKLLDLESKAKALIDDYNASKKSYEENYAQIVKYSKLDASSLSEEDANKYTEETNSIINNLSFLERTLSMQAENVNSIIKNFEVCRNSIVTLKQK